ncbi:ATP-dependent DNA helicase PIF1-like [Hydra vulgaris]|uniref:ATP-dependent DNA helicase PIF1-like n=1 Tax=Hydra vulgaris TaxID=6087 RepID=UPI0032E9DEE1
MDGPAGSGKTFTYNYLIAETRSRGIKSATAAWTGIAVTLLTNGSTLHGLFKLPVPILDNSTCNVTPNSIHGHFLSQASLFLLDETSMIPKHALNAIDRLLKDVCNNNFPFEGKVILFGGDFRQILPVVKREQPAEVVEACIKCSLHWQWVQKFKLTESMRVHDGEREFSNWLLRLGSGTIFGDAEQDGYAKRVILTPTNVDSLSINEEVLQRLPGEVKTYLSADQVETDNLNERNNFPVEFLNSLIPSDFKAGLCNGTRMKVCALQNNYIDAEVLTGVSAGKRVFVPRIHLAPSDSNLPFVLKRRQFPVRLAYSMTINKSQGQTFDRVGVYLKKPCFTHDRNDIPLQCHRDDRKYQGEIGETSNITGMDIRKCRGQYYDGAASMSV